MFLGTITQGQTILHGQYFGGKSCTALVRTDGGPRYLCAACCPMELGPSDFILPTIKGAGTEARGLKGGLGGRGSRRWGEWKGISYPWTCAVAPWRSPGGCLVWCDGAKKDASRCDYLSIAC